MPATEVKRAGAAGRKSVAPLIVEEQRGVARVGQLVALVLFVGAAVCGFVSAARASQPTSATPVAVIDYDFSPHTVTVAPESTVVFRNDGVATHRVVADDGSFDSHGLQPGNSWSVTVGGEA